VMLTKSTEGMLVVADVARPASASSRGRCVRDGDAPTDTDSSIP
jgi:hypothetical protein